MPKYPCPNCKSDLCVDLTFDKRIHVSCPSCGLHELFDGSGGTDMAVMEFACSYDEGKLASESQSPSDSAQGMVRQAFPQKLRLITFDQRPPQEGHDT